MSTARMFAIIGVLALACLPSLESYAGDAELVLLMKKSGGALTPQVREAFLRDAEARVVAELAGVKVKLSTDQLDAVRNDPVMRDASFATIYPADPRILLNMLELRKEAGAEFFENYKSLFVAGAVARRLVGVGAEAFGEKEEWALRSRSEAEQKTGMRRWPEYSVVDVVAPEYEDGGGDKKKTPKHRVVIKREEKAEHRRDKMTDPEGLEVIADFLKEKKITPAQLNGSAALKKELLTKMGDQAPKSGAISYELLYKMMTREGLRPEERDPFPSTVEFARYLDGIKPRFPIKTAPWPLLMPLAKGWPLREASNIWERVQTSGKLPTYGKYRGKDQVIAARLEPSPWHWQSWQGTYQAGGVCHEMSTIGLGTYMSVGVPAEKAGQPHHSCVLVFSHSEMGWFVGTKQGRHGPADTHSQWLFADPNPERPEVYHMGLALSMNVGLTPFVDSRIGVHLAEILSHRLEPGLAAKVLQAAVRRNPYNTQAWCALDELREPDTTPALQKARLLHLLSTLVSSSPDDVLHYRQKPADVSLEGEVDEDYLATNPRKWSATYANLIGKTMLLPGLAPSGKRDVDAQIVTLLQSCAASGIPLHQVIAEFEKTMASRTNENAKQVIQP